MNSPQNPARPGRPSEAMAVNASIPPRIGISFMFPPRRDISLVWYRCCIDPARKKSIPVMRPCATIPITAALMPTSVRVAMPSMTKPM